MSIVINPGEDFNMYSPEISFVQVMAKDINKVEFCIGFYGKGRKEQQNFFYDPNFKHQILRQTHEGICLDCYGKEIFPKSGTYEVWLRIGYEDGNIRLGGVDEVKVV
jgi:hypothetical protein